MISVMTPTTGNGRAGLRTLSLASLALAASMLVIGCGSESDPSPEQEAIGRSVSELEAPQSNPGDGSADPLGGDTDPGAPGTKVFIPNGSSAPLDPIAGPDPIPWHRSASGAHASDT